jgi:hypothetical protein
MGSVTGSAKAPSRQTKQIVYVPAPVASTAVPASNFAPSREQELQTRAENVLKRSRSRLGTVLTGFAGILSQGDLIAPRKNLLGE